MRPVAFLFLVGLVNAICCSALDAQENELSVKQKFTLISSLAQQTCTAVRDVGGETKKAAEARIEVGVKGLLNKLLNTGIEADAKFESSTYQGVKQEQLVEAIKQSNNCKLSLTTMLIERLITVIPDNRLAPPQVNKPPGSGLSVSQIAKPLEGYTAIPNTNPVTFPSGVRLLLNLRHDRTRDETVLVSTLLLSGPALGAGRTMSRCKA
jgi:hypothetical protein